MKLLEERTQQSKHEMDLAESLDELKELNRRKKEVGIIIPDPANLMLLRLTTTSW